jgi:hypothetical protein
MARSALTGEFCRALTNIVVSVASVTAVPVPHLPVQTLVALSVGCAEADGA